MIPALFALLINILAIPIVIYVGKVIYSFFKKKQKTSKFKFIFAMLFLWMIVYPVNMMVLDFLQWKKNNDTQSKKETIMQKSEKAEEVELN